MATAWSQIVEHGLVYEVWDFYRSQNIPLQIRSIQPNKFYSEWLEDSCNKVVIKTLNPSDPCVKEFTSQFASQFFKKLSAIIKQRISDAKLRQQAHWEVGELDLQQRISELELRFKDDAFGFFTLIHQCLRFERDLIAAKVKPDNPVFEPLPQPIPMLVSPVAEKVIFSVNQEICDLRLKRDELAMETNAVRIKENSRHSPDFDSGVELLEFLLQKDSLKHKGKSFADLGQQIFQQLIGQVNQICNELELWAVDQRSVLNGAQSTVSLTDISVLTDIVAKGLLDLYQILKVYNGTGVLDPRVINSLEELKLSTQGAAKKLIIKTFIVEEQPRQILLLKSRVKKSNDDDKLETGMKVRLLVGTTLKCFEHPVVKVSLISRQDAEKVYNDQDKSRTYFPQPAMELPDTNKRLELDEKNDAFIANFAKIEMPKSRKKTMGSTPKGSAVKKDPKDIDPVPRKKYYFHFRASYSCPDMDIKEENIFTTSAPVIANSHTKEKDDSWACILWDNASAEVGKNPFEVKTEIECAHLVDVFSNLFKKDTGRPLSARNKQFLTDKLLSCATSPKFSETTVTWDMFFQNTIKIPCLRPEPHTQTVTFHSWLYEIKKYCTPSSRNKTGIPKFWKEGRIEGFISKEALTDILKQKRGRFALYFSEALLGGLTVAWWNFDLPEPALQRLSPFTPSTFVENNELERRLYDQKQLMFLHQDHSDVILKKNVFPFPDDDSERMTPIQREMQRRSYIQTFQETRNMNMDTTFMHPVFPSTSGTMRPDNFITAL